MQPQPALSVLAGCYEVVDLQYFLRSLSCMRAQNCPNYVGTRQQLCQIAEQAQSHSHLRLKEGFPNSLYWCIGIALLCKTVGLTVMCNVNPTCLPESQRAMSAYHCLHISQETSILPSSSLSKKKGPARARPPRKVRPLYAIAA